MLRRPERQECEEYYFLYIDQAPADGILAALSEQAGQVAGLFESLPPDRRMFRYAPDKWTPKEILGHLVDVERVFSFRAFTFARSDPGPLPAMEQDEYARAARYAERPIEEIVAEYRAARNATLALFHSFGENEWGRTGIASGFRFTIRSFPYILAGHERHHCRVVCERYMSENGSGSSKPAWLLSA